MHGAAARKQGAAKLTQSEMMYHRALAQALACGLAAASCSVCSKKVFKKVKSCGGLWRPSKYVGEYSLLPWRRQLSAQEGAAPAELGERRLSHTDDNSANYVNGYDCSAAYDSYSAGDGYCDYNNNYYPCYDGGDCCASTCQDNYDYTYCSWYGGDYCNYCGQNGYNCQDYGTPSDDYWSSSPDDDPYFSSSSSSSDQYGVCLGRSYCGSSWCSSNEFCNFDYYGSSCESCSSFPNADECYNDGLPSAGATDCRACCFGTGYDICEKDICCAEDEDDCCENDVGAITGLFFGLLALVICCIVGCCVGIPGCREKCAPKPKEPTKKQATKGTCCKCTRRYGILGFLNFVCCALMCIALLRGPIWGHSVVKYDFNQDMINSGYWGYWWSGDVEDATLTEQNDLWVLEIIDHSEVDKKTIKENKMETCRDVGFRRRLSHEADQAASKSAGRRLGHEYDELAGGARSDACKIWMYGAIVARYTTAAAVLLMLPCAIFMLAVACGCRIKCCCDCCGGPADSTPRLFMVTAGFLMAGGIIGLGGAAFFSDQYVKALDKLEKEDGDLVKMDVEYTSCHWGCAFAVLSGVLAVVVGTITIVLGVCRPVNKKDTTKDAQAPAAPAATPPATPLPPASPMRKAACAMPGCTKTAVHMCSACESVYYCSPEHQMSHWPDHKVVCRPIAPTTVVRQPEASEPLPSEEELEPEA